MNRKKGLFGLSAAAGVVAASSLLAFAGTGSAATSNSAAAFGVQSSGAEPHAARAVRVDDDGGDAHGIGRDQGRLRQGRRCDRHHQPGQVQCHRHRRSAGATAPSGAAVTTTCSNGKATVTIAGATPSALNGTYTRCQDGHHHRWHRHRPRRLQPCRWHRRLRPVDPGRAPTASRSPVRPARRRRRRRTPRRPTSTPTCRDGDEHPPPRRARRPRPRPDEHPDGDQHADRPAERRTDPDPDRDEPPGHGLNPGLTRGLLRQHRHVVQVNAEPAPSPADRGRRRFVVRRQGVGRAGAPGRVSAAASAGRRRGG